jgi:signal transduction histidine kinase
MIDNILKGKWHIKPRVFAMLLLLLAVVFTSVFVAFNLFINSYIRNNVEIQLNGLVDNFGNSGLTQHGEPPNGFQAPNLSGQFKNKIGARGEVIILDVAYQIKEFNEFSVSENSVELSQIAEFLKEENIPLTNAKNIHVTTSYGEYYVSSIKDSRAEDSFLVFYVNVSGLYSLMDTVNTAMAAIMAAAMLICFVTANLIAGSVTEPIKKLSAFAGEIGKGNFSRTYFSFRDIEFDELGNAMNESAEKLDLYDEDQKTFFQNVSHELRTPLQSIRAHAEGIQYGLMDSKKSAATIITETDRLSALVEDLLYISRIDSIAGEIEKKENDLRETLALCAEAHKALANKKGIRFIYEFDDEAVLYTYNEKHMYRAFSNLISNALRYADSIVTLRCGKYNGRVEVSIIDDGAGVSPDDMPHVFERFYKGKGGKHGIGLSIVKSAVELNGGTVTVISDQGACFTIRFNK